MQTEPLWREVTGRVLRRHRHDRGERLVETAARAGVSSQYLSEIERGRKDASSELLAAVAGALELSLLDLTCEVVTELSRHAGALGRARATVPVRLRSTEVTVRPMFGRNGSRGPVALAA